MKVFDIIYHVNDLILIYMYTIYHITINSVDNLINYFDK